MPKRVLFVACFSVILLVQPFPGAANENAISARTDHYDAGAEPFSEPTENPPHKAIWLVDDFEDGFSPGWIDPPGGTTGWIDSIGAAGTDHSLRIDGASGGFDMWFDLVGAQPTGINLFVRSGSTSSADAYVVLGDDDTASNAGSIFFYAHHEGQLSVYTDGQLFSCGAYTADTWYDIGFTVDWQCQAFDVYVDGTLRQYNLPFRNPADFFSQLHVLNFHNSTAWWDQITMSSPPPGMFIFGDGFERESTCRWSATVD